MGSTQDEQWARQLAFVAEAAQLWEPGRGDIGYLARIFAQTSLPYRDPGAVPAWGRRNGDISLTVQPGTYVDKNGEIQSVGYPYGTIPRLMLAWISTEIKTQTSKTPVLQLGDSLADFLRQLGLQSTGGANGTIGRLRKQLERLFLASLVIRYDGDERRQAGARVGVATSYDLWWSNRDPALANQPALLPSYVQLSDEFYQEVLDRPVPLSIPALRKIKDSALALDIYTWLTYRMCWVKRRTEVPWSALRMQFGSSFADTRQGRFRFQEKFRDQLAQVLTVYPQASVEVERGGLVLRPSRTHVAPNGRWQDKALTQGADGRWTVERSTG
jgi:replication initiator protein